MRHLINHPLESPYPDLRKRNKLRHKTLNNTIGPASIEKQICKKQFQVKLKNNKNQNQEMIHLSLQRSLKMKICVAANIKDKKGIKRTIYQL